MEAKDLWAKAREEELRLEFKDVSVDRILRERKLPRIVELAMEASPMFKSKVIQEMVNHALKVLEVTSDPKELEKSLSESKGYRIAKFGQAWSLSVHVALGIVLDLLDGRDVFNPTALDVHNSKTVCYTVLSYVPEGFSPEGFNAVKYKWIEDFIARHPELK